jgi:hypothetical protein
MKISKYEFSIANLTSVPFGMRGFLFAMRKKTAKAPGREGFFSLKTSSCFRVFAVVFREDMQ